MAFVVLDEEKYVIKGGKLDLHSKNIKDISEVQGLKNFSELQVLYLDRNEISEIKGLDGLKKLRVLELSNNSITEIKELQDLINLQWLNLRSNQIIDINKLSSLRNLKILNLHDNKINEIRELESLTNLQELNISNNKILIIKGLENSSNLQELDLKNNQISEIDGLGFLINLERLIIDNNRITEISGLENLTNLRELSITANQITVIKGLETLTKLRALNLSNNQITDIKGLESLTNLRFLNLEGNRIPRDLIDKLGGLNQRGEAKNPQKIVKYCLERFETERAEREKRHNEAINYIKKIPSIYSEITFEKLESKTGIKFEELEPVIEDMILNKEIKAQIKGHKLVFKKEEAEVIPTSKRRTLIPLNIGEYRSRNIKILRGGDWKIEGNQSVFFYKVKIQNNSQYVISNIQVIFGDVPQGLELRTDKFIEFAKLNPYDGVSPTYKLYANDNCVGSELKGNVNYTDHFGKTYTVKIEPFEICYVCNLLVPKMVSREVFNRKVEHMQGRTMKIDSSLNPLEIEKIIRKNIQECNFALLQEIRESQDKGFRKIEGLAQGLYDNQDVAISVAMRQFEGGSEIEIQTLSDKIEKTTDLMKDISIKLEDIKSDTQKVQDVIYYLDESKIRETLNIIIDKPKELNRVIYKVIKNPDWADEEKDKWAKIVMETLNYYKLFKPPKWLKFVKGITKITLGESASNAITDGVEQLVNWLNLKIAKKKSNF